MTGGNDNDGHSCFELNEDVQKWFLELKEDMSSKLLETEEHENNCLIVKDNGDGSFVVLGFFDCK